MRRKSRHLFVPLALISMIAGGAHSVSSADLQPRVAVDLRLVPLIEAVPDSAILANADPDDADGDEISGRVHQSFSLLTFAPGIGRYGWKATAVTLEDQVFAGFHASDSSVESIDPDQINLLSAQLRAQKTMPLLQQPPQLFENARCSACHTDNGGLFSDLLLHDMGEGLADFKAQGFALRSEWRTAPLRFLNGRPCFLHDCRAQTLTQAINLHGGEAASSTQSFSIAAAADRVALLNWLKNLD